MIKLIFRIFFLLIAASITLAILYVFELPPFQGSPSPAATTTTTDEQQLANEQKNLPDELKEDKIARDKSYQEMIDRAAELAKNNFPSLAIAQYQEAFKKDSSNLVPLYEIGKIQIRTANYSKAEEVFKDLVKRDPTNLEAKVYLGRALLGQRKITDARQVFDAVTEPNQTIKYYQAIIAAYFGENERAQNLLNETIKMGGSDDITKKANNFLGAYNEYKFNVESPELHLKVLLARSFNQCGEYQMAIPLLFEVTKAKLDYRDAWILLGYAYLQTEKYQDAIEALERAKVLDDQKPETLFYLGLGYYSINNFKLAEENLSKAKQYGFEPKILVDQKLAEIYLELQNYPKSAASYEAVLSLNSQDVNYYIKPVWIYLEKTNEPKKALALAQKAVKDHPQEAMGENLLGWAYLYNNELKKAEDHLKYAQGLNPDLDATYLNFGMLYERQNQLEKALTFYERAHTLGNGSGVAAAAATRYNKLLAKMNTTTTMQANIVAP